MTSRLLKPGALALGALVLGIIADVLFFEHVPGVSVPLFTAAFLGAVVLYDRIGHKYMSWYEVSLASLLFVLSLFFAFRASEFLLALNAVAMTYLLGMLLASLYGASVRTFRILDFIAFPFIDLIIAVASTAGIIKHLRPKTLGRNTRVMRGTVIGLVLAVIFLALFAAADPVFAELLTRIISPEFLRELMARGVNVLLIGLVVLLALAPAFWRRAEMREIVPFKPTRQFGIEAAIALGVSNALFALFIIVRSAFLFSGDARLAEFDLTYAEYAREGFFQMLIVALIVAAIVWCMRMVKSGRADAMNRALQVVLIIQTALILGSSWMALSAYEAAFGFTHLRLFSHYFLLVVTAVLLLFMVGVIKPKLKDAFLLHGVVFIFAIGLLGLNIMNPDALIANHNIERAEAGEELDYRLLFVDLSADAAPAILEHMQSIHPSELDVVTKVHPGNFSIGYRASVGHGPLTIRSADVAWREHLYEEHDTAWQSWNASRAWAYRNVAIEPQY